MNEDRKRILNLVASGKLTIEEAEQLLDALGKKTAGGSFEMPSGTDAPVVEALKKAIKFLRVEVRSVNGDNVNVRVPVGLLRAGLKLSSLIPPQAFARMNAEMSRQGINFDLNSLKPQDIEMLIESLGELDVNVNAASGDTVKVFCE